MIVFDKELIGPWICARIGGSFDKESCSTIGLTNKDDGLIAGVMYDHFNGRSLCMHVAAEGARWMTRDYLWTCFDYPFNQLKVGKIIGLVDSSNANARRFDEHLGFHLEAVIPDAGRHGDLLIYTMTRQQCRWLGEKHGRQIRSTTGT